MTIPSRQAKPFFLALVVGLLIAMLVAQRIGPAASATPLTATVVVVRVIDGDTFELAGGERLRVANFDAPEIRRPACAEERRLGHAAKDAADALVKGVEIGLIDLGRDRWGRRVAEVRLLGGTAPRDFRAAMTEGGHGAFWAYGQEAKPNWC